MNVDRFFRPNCATKALTASSNLPPGTHYIWQQQNHRACEKIDAGSKPLYIDYSSTPGCPIQKNPMENVSVEGFKPPQRKRCWHHLGSLYVSSNFQTMRHRQLMAPNQRLVNRLVGEIHTFLGCSSKPGCPIKNSQMETIMET